MKYRILIADDDAGVSRPVQAWLKKAGHDCVVVSDPAALAGGLADFKPELLLLDVVYGDADGFKICARLRAAQATRGLPIVMISGSKMKEKDMVGGMKVGADDYLLKPLNEPYLLAKIEAVMRRYRAPAELKDMLTAFGLALEIPTRKVFVKEKEVGLTRKEFDLLTTLLRRRPRITTPKSLLETVWGYELEVYDNTRTVEVHISRLKKKLGKDFASHIKTAIGVGYRID